MAENQAKQLQAAYVAYLERKEASKGRGNPCVPPTPSFFFGIYNEPGEVIAYDAADKQPPAEVLQSLKKLAADLGRNFGQEMPHSESQEDKK